MLAAAALALGVAPAAASAAQVGVAIPAKYFLPSDLQVVVGDTVTWRNSDHDTHNLVADDLDFASGLLAPGGSFSHTFDAPGIHPYVCTIHAGMTGDVDAVPIALAGPAAPPTAGERFTLTGRAPLGVGSVTIERSATPGAPFTAAGDPVSTAPDGSFSATFKAEGAAAWRAVNGDLASPPVPVPVAPRLNISLTARRTATLIVLSVRTRPVRPGETVRLQLYSRERFAWLPAGRAQLDSAGRITFSVRRSVRRMARVVFAKDGVVVSSRPLALWRVR
jgi:plastocyanin